MSGNFRCYYSVWIFGNSISFKWKFYFDRKGTDKN